MAVSMKPGLVKDTCTTSSPYILDYQDSSNTLVETAEYWINEKESSTISRRKRRHSLLKHWKVVLERFNYANEQWQDNRVMTRQRRREKRPQDGKTNPFE